METTVNAPPTSTSVKIGPVEFRYALRDAVMDQKELRAEALTAWLVTEWKRERENEATA